MTPEAPLSPAAADLLLATARSSLTVADIARLHAALSEIEDWNDLVEAALAHGTAGLLCHHLLASGHDLSPDAIVEAAEAFVAFRHVEHARAARDLADVLDSLAAACVDALPYKGLVLAAQTYAEPALRGCRDLDVLIRESDIAAAMTALEGLGYRTLQAGLSPRRMRAFHAYNGQDALVRECRTPVEPHWRLGPRTLHAEIDVDGLFARAAPVEVDGRAFPGPSREDTLLICGIHGSKEEWSRLIWIADVAELLRGAPAIDWSALLARADASGVRRMVLIGIALARDLLDAPLPPPLAAALEGDAMAERLATIARQRLFLRRGETPSVYRVTSFRLRMRERWRDQVRYVAATLLTARAQHFRFIDLPERLSFLYPLVRLGHDYVALPLWRLAHPRAR